MHKSTKWRVGAAIAVAVLAGCASTPAPDRELAVARESVAQAVPEAERYAPEPLRLARAKLSQAEDAMAREEYAEARRLAEQATADARLAQASARSERAQAAAAQVNETLRTLRRQLDAQTPDANAGGTR